MSRKNRIRRCEVYLCENQFISAQKDVRWHLLPTDPKRRKAWLDNIRLDPEGKPLKEDEKKSITVCSAHFKECDFVKSLETNAKRAMLKKTAVPTIFAWTSKADCEGHHQALYVSPTSKRHKQLRSIEEQKMMDMDIMEDSGLKDSIEGDDDEDAVHQKQSIIKYLEREKRRLAEENASLSSVILSVRTENDLLRGEKELLKQEHSTEMIQLNARLLTYDKIKNDNNLVSFYTGFKDDLSFTAFYAYIEENVSRLTYLLKGGKNKIVRRLSTPIRLKPGESFPIGNRDMLFIVLIRLKVGFPTTEIARMFGIGTAIIKRIFTTWIEFLYVELKTLFPIPAVPKPSSFLTSEHRLLVKLKVDCLDVRVQKASMVKTQQNQLFTYKHYKTMKFLMATTMTGSVCFVSPLFDGGLSDTKVFRDSGLIKDLSEGYAILAGDRFQLSDILPKGVSAITDEACELTDTSNNLASTTKPATDKTHMEIALKRLKMYRILDTPIPFPLGVYADKIVAVCAYLTNLKPDFNQGI